MAHPPSPASAPAPADAPAPSQAPPAELHWSLALLATALAYAVVGVLALQLAIPPGFASPLYPSAGIALVAVLVFGWRVLPGVALGSLLVNLTLSLQRGQVDLTAFTVPAAIAVGAALQAGVGAWLVRRFVRQPLTLGEPRDIALFFGLGAVLACTVSASLAGWALVHSGTVPASSLPITWLTWWAGDTLGVLIGAPITLTLIGRPRAEWAPRRLTVGLTLLLVTAFIATGIAQVARWDEERARNAFERDADNATSAVRAQLQEPLHALEAMRGVFIASEDVTQQELQRASRAWLEPGNLLALGWSERMRRRDVPAFEARVRMQGLPGYRVFDRTDADGSTAPPNADDPVVAMRHIEPAQGNATALGVNSMSIPVARVAIDRASATGLPQATAGFRLTQQRADEDRTGVVIYAALYHDNPKTVAERVQAARGVVFVTLRPDTLLAKVQPRLAPGLSLCLIDTDPAAVRRRLAGPPGCDTDRAAARYVRPLAYAGRQWDLHVLSQTSEAARAGGANAWLFALVGLLASSLLGALMLTVTGRARRIEEAVHLRTAALQAEIAEREQAQAALQDSEQRFRNIWGNVPIGIIYTNLRGRVIRANPRFCELTGYRENELLNQPAALYTHPDDTERDVELASQLVRGDIPMYRREKRCVTRDGRTVWVQSNVSLLRDAQGQPRYIVGAVEDITERLRLHDAEKARELAEASNRAKSEFLSRMSHELRTPLNAILGFAQLLDHDKRHPLLPAQRPWVDRIQHAGWHLLEMINDVLDLSRIESGSLRLQPEPLAVSALIADVLPMVRAEAQQRGLAVSTRLDADTLLALGDPTRVRQIVINLLSNAVKYNVDGGRIEVRSRRQAGQPEPGATPGPAPDWVQIEVTDSGIGMTPQQHADLFKPFNRLGQERSAQPGTGIGLVISKSLAEAMGGSLGAEPAPGGGTRFVLTLPAAHSGATAAGHDASPPLPRHYGERVVHYVEDNETNVEVMRGVLAQRPQLRMEVSVNGAQALLALRASVPDLILLDMHLPDTTGLDLLRRLKADAALTHVPVVAVSADALPDNVDAALIAGAADYLTKPVEVARLLAVLDRQFAVSAFGGLGVDGR
ncbi:MAG: hypothetical protein AD742_21280 [Methylibium sp. NZG]|nr:MAG: hypothetical protein AD742_21280 [Methylibium sp. NZG]